MNVLQSLRDHLSPVLAGFKPVFYRWYDEDTAPGAQDSVLLRPSGGGRATELGQYPEVTIAVCTQNGHQAYEQALAMRDYLIDNFAINGVCNFEIPADVSGPFVLANERNVCELKVRCWT